jgi:hypothetical protein
MSVFGAAYEVCNHDPRPDDGGSKHLWNVGKLLPDYTAQHPRRHTRSRENLKILFIIYFED